MHRWWLGLPDEERSALLEAWDARREDIAWTSAGRRWEPLPIRVQGRTDIDPLLGPERRLMQRQLLEFINGHEEVRFFFRDVKFIVCRAHSPARRALAEGVMPAGFRCPVRGEACPMRAISAAAGERAVHIELRVDQARVDRASPKLPACPSCSRATPSSGSAGLPKAR
ncbi:MAG: hypothetical protein AAGH15_03950 [Myxococcota bacterium]